MAVPGRKESNNYLFFKTRVYLFCFQLNLYVPSGNDLQDYGASKICEMLKKNTCLKHLYLSHNKFEERAALSFKEALSHNETLLTLDISWNHFRTNGAVAIAEGVQVSFAILYEKN